VEHEVCAAMTLMEGHNCGTLTPRELAELLTFRGLCPPNVSLAELERDLLTSLGVEGSKELEGRELVHAFNFILTRNAMHVLAVAGVRRVAFFTSMPPPTLTASAVNTPTGKPAEA
jgi:hypothetical protein